MMQCLSFNLKPSTQTQTQTPSSSFPTSPQAQAQAQARTQGNSSEGTSPSPSPRSSTTHLSPTFNLSQEYTLAVNTNSYNEIRSRIEEQLQVESFIESGDTDAHHRHHHHHQLLLSQVLHPNRDCVHQALRYTNPKATLTRLVSTYFDHSENISAFCLLLYQCLCRARTLYAPISDLLQVFPYELSSINQSQCNWAFDVFHQFYSIGNPFPCPDSHNLDEMRRSFSQLKKQLDQHIYKSLSRGRFLQRATTASAICLIGTVVGVVVSAVVISTHALAAVVGLVATPLCPIYVPTHPKKKQLAHMAQLHSASRGSYFHNKDLDTIDSLVAWLYNAVEGHRQLILIILERDGDIYPIHEVVKQLRNNHKEFFDQLKELEDHIYLCFNAVNKYRAKLLDQIHLPQSSNS